jgi:hypothetical protein
VSQENVDIVRRHIEPYDGRDLVSAIRDAYEGLDLDDPNAVAAAVTAMVAEDPAWQDVDPQIVWDATSLGVSSVAHGISEVAAYWRDWAGLWESYVYRVAEYRDLGDWVLSVSDVCARGRDGIHVELRSFQAWGVRRGKITAMRGDTSEAGALAKIESAELAG